jgi:omega-6 fatty acid desaturase (delta-12 desaturase)
MQSEAGPEISEEGIGEIPSWREVKQVIPAHCFETHLGKSFLSLGFSLALTLLVGWAAAVWIPLTWAALPLWIAYAVVNGTIAVGCWVVAHECGHYAFCKSKPLQDTIGFFLHSALLVPYFSWQRSHAIHHANTNHLTSGETHVPVRLDSRSGQFKWQLRQRLGKTLYGMFVLFGLVVGWPLYLLIGVTGGSKYGVTNHFWPYWPFSGSLFPGRWKGKVLVSAAGVFTVLGALGAVAYQIGSIWPLIALYGGPYLVVNAWLVTYTWLHHTEEDIPHLDDDTWNPVRAAFLTVDRPYGPIVDRLHHRIGTTHVVHHLFSRIPHYHAREATRAVKEHFPDLYLYDDTPIWKAIWRTAHRCVVVDWDVKDWMYKKIDADRVKAAVEVRPASVSLRNRSHSPDSSAPPHRHQRTSG